MSKTLSRPLHGRVAARLTRFPVPSLQATISFAVVSAAVLFVLFQMQPSLLITETTPSGGDTGSHVWGPHYLRHHLLPQGRIFGWAPDWYAGFPAYTFYFPLPALLIVMLDLLLPYGVAFKLITVSGVLALPVAAYAFGRLAGMRFPGPPVLAVATVPFLFDRTFTIYGGNIASTLAGEFSFTIGLALALVFLGVVARALDTGKHRALAAVLLALTGLSHLLPTLFAVVGAGVMFLLRPGRRRALLVASVFGVGALLAAFWSFPFLMRLTYANNMGWEKITAYQQNLFPPATRWAAWMALAGAISAIALRRRVALFLVLMAVVSGVVFVLAPESRLWNVRALPFWYLSLYLLAGVAVAEAGPELGRLLARDPGAPSPFAALVTPVTAAVAAWVLVGLPLGVLPSLPTLRWLVLVVAAAAVAAAGYRLLTGAVLLGVAALTGVAELLGQSRFIPLFKLSVFLLTAVVLTELVLIALQRRRSGGGKATGSFAQGATPVAAAVALGLLVAAPLGLVGRVFERPATADSSFIPSWAKWNYSGYERKDAYPEYRALVDTMKTVGRDRGCGRANWEYESAQDRFGTPMALMLLPYWTDGCIGSMEGLYFESSPTVPYHFLSAGELSKAPSNPQRDLPYRSLDVAAGVEHLQMLGARYYMAFSPEAVSQARQNESLTHIASGPSLPASAGVPERRWEIFEVAGAELVEPLQFQPAVYEGRGKGEHDWMSVSVNWYMDRSLHDVPLAASGPKSWPRVKVRKQPTTASTVGADVKIGSVPHQPVPAATVTNIRTTNDSISFDVDNPGSPVLVKTSYFPNWTASGADGPWRVTPNLMVVVPRERHVSMHYSWTPVEAAGGLLTAAGIGLTIVMARRRPMSLVPATKDGGADGDVGEADPEAAGGPEDVKVAEPQPSASASAPAPAPVPVQGSGTSS